VSYGLKYYCKGNENGTPDYGLCSRPANQLCYSVHDVEKVFQELEYNIAKLADKLRNCGEQDYVDSILAGGA